MDIKFSDLLDEAFTAGANVRKRLPHRKPLSNVGFQARKNKQGIVRRVALGRQKVNPNFQVQKGKGKLI